MEFTTTTYNALLDVCARSGEISRAEPLLKQMVEQGLAPSVITYSTVIKAYCGANMLEQAFKLFEAKSGDIFRDIFGECGEWGFIEDLELSRLSAEQLGQMDGFQLLGCEVLYEWHEET